MSNASSPRTIRNAAVAAAALALTSASTAVLASPAAAVASQRVYYLCSSPDLGTFTASAIHRVTSNDRGLRATDSTPRPVGVVYSGDVKVTTTLLLPAKVVQALNSTYVGALDGFATTWTSLSSVTLTAEQEVDKTPVPDSGAMKLVAPGYVNIGPADLDAGTTAALALADIAGDDFVTELYAYYGDDRSEDPTPVTCQLDDDQDLAVGEVTVTKAPVRGYATFRYNDKTGKIVSRIGLSAVNSSATPDGTMTLTLKRNGVVIDSKTAELENGRIFMRTPAPKGGDYEMLEEYDGTRNFGSESGSRGFSFS